MTQKPMLFSGVQPSGNLHLGNYLGAISQWLEMQADYTCLFSIVNYHSITVSQNPQELAKKTLELAKIYLASGLDPKKTIIFTQSDVSEHTELAWILNCTSTRISDLKKMTQFKDKSQKDGGENVSVGLLDYPVLMAADILLYNTNVVPVGDDQLQHVELARTLARRFNQQYGETFVVPEAKIRKTGARIMGLDDPTKKMSKSAASPANYIALTDSPEIITKKIMRAVTDSDGQVKYDEKNKPAISNLVTIYHLVSGQSIKDLEKKYAGLGYGDFKKDLAAAVINFLADFQKKYQQISDRQVLQILKTGAQRARKIAAKTMEKVRKEVGII